MKYPVTSKINEKLNNLSTKLEMQNKEVEELKDSQTFINQEFEEIKKSMNNMAKKHEKEIQMKIKAIENKQIQTNKKFEKMDLALENLEQYGRRYNLEQRFLTVGP